MEKTYKAVWASKKNDAANVSLNLGKELRDRKTDYCP